MEDIAVKVVGVGLGTLPGLQGVGHGCSAKPRARKHSRGGYLRYLSVSVFAADMFVTCPVGNTASWGLSWRLASGSVLFKVDSEYCTAYSAALRPWVNFVPVRSDLSDLENATRIIMSRDPWDLQLLEAMQAKAAQLAQTGFTYEAQVRRVAHALSAHSWNQGR